MNKRAAEKERKEAKYGWHTDGRRQQEYRKQEDREQDQMPRQQPTMVFALEPQPLRNDSL